MAGASPMEAASRVDEQELAKSFARKAMAANACLMAIRQRGEGLFTDYTMQIYEAIVTNLDLIAHGVSATERVPEGSVGPPKEYSTALNKVSELAKTLVNSSSQTDGEEDKAHQARKAAV